MTKLPGGFGFPFTFGQMARLPDGFLAGFSTNKPARSKKFFNGTRVAKQDTP